MGIRSRFNQVIAPSITLLGLLLIAPAAVRGEEETVTPVEKAIDSGKTTLRPEITSMVIYDGSVRSVRYYAPRLSAAEKVVLKELEDADLADGSGDVRAIQCHRSHERCASEAQKRALAVGMKRLAHRLAGAGEARTPPQRHPDDRSGAALDAALA